MLNVEQLNSFIDEHFTRTAFRMEVLPQFAVASDGDDFHRYVRGEPEPTPERKEPWLRTLRNERAAGKLRHRVRIVRTPLNDYLRYECEWGYVPNTAAGEDIRVIDLTDTDLPAEVITEEFWLLDDTHALRMIYDGDGRFLGAEPTDDVEPYRRARDAAIALAEPFTQWWQRHPEEWRVNRNAA